MPGLVQPKRLIILDPETNHIHGAFVESAQGEMRELIFAQPFPAKAWDAWQQGAHIQNALPLLTPDEREFLLTGMTPEEWDAAFGEDD